MFSAIDLRRIIRRSPSMRAAWCFALTVFLFLIYFFIFSVRSNEERKKKRTPPYRLRDSKRISDAGKIIDVIILSTVTPYYTTRRSRIRTGRIVLRKILFRGVFFSLLFQHVCDGEKDEQITNKRFTRTVVRDDVC